jgi:hypothetical protein
MIRSREVKIRFRCTLTEIIILLKHNRGDFASNSVSRIDKMGGSHDIEKSGQGNDVM